MKKYVLKRLLSLIPTIFIVSVVIFLLVHLTPGDPAAAMLGEDATAAEIAALHTQLGLDDPLVVQYFRWVGNCLRLDFGTSTAVVNKPVSEMIASHFQPTILLAIYSQLITILIAIPCGMLAAKKRGTIADYFVSVLSMLGISLPSFLMGLGMVLLFAVNLRVLPAAGYKNPFTDGFLPFLRYMTLPAVSLGFIHAGYMMRMTKASMLEVLGSDYPRGVHDAHDEGIHAGGLGQRLHQDGALQGRPRMEDCYEAHLPQRAADRHHRRRAGLHQRAGGRGGCRAPVQHSRHGVADGGFHREARLSGDSGNYAADCHAQRVHQPDYRPDLRLG